MAVQGKHIALKQPRLHQCKAIFGCLLVAGLMSLQCTRGTVSTQKPETTPARALGTLIPFTMLAKGNHSAITVPRQLVIRSDADWRQLWFEHVAGLVAPPRLLQVDFRTHMAIAVFRGNTEGGFPITITAIEKRTTELAVFFEELSPPPGFPLGVAVVLQPYHIVQVEWLSLPVVFQKRPHQS